jgi:hypothetical protein
VPDIDATNDPAFFRKEKGLPYSPSFGGANISLLPTLAGPSSNEVADIQGELIAEFGTEAYEYLKNNPAEAAGLAITAVPGIGLAFKIGKGAVNIGKFLIGKGAKFIKNRPMTAATIGGTGAFVGQDAINEMIENLPTFPGAMTNIKEGAKGIAALPKKAYEGVRDFMEFESPGMSTPRVNTTLPNVDVEPAVAPESVRDAQRMMDINEIPVAEDRMPLEERLKEIDKSKEEKPTIPKINGGESPNQLNQKEEVINSNLDELAIRLSKFARSDPRKPGGYTAASFQRDQEILTEKQKAQALRMKQRELDIRADLNNIRREQLTQNYFIQRLASLDKQIVNAQELFREGPLYTNAINEIAVLTKALEKEQEKSGIFGFGGPDEEKIQLIQADIKKQRDIIKVGETALTGNFLAERNALSNKYTELYTNYTGDDKKEDFNLKDQRTVGQ